MISAVKVSGVGKLLPTCCKANERVCAADNTLFEWWNVLSLLFRLVEPKINDQ